MVDHNGAMASPEEMTAALVASMHERTGHDLDEWVAIVESSGIDPLDQNAVRRWLKAEHGIAQNTQWAIAFEVAGRHGWTMPTAEQFTDEMYSGKKAPLRPLHDALVTACADAGPDTTVEGRGTYTPIIRGRQFAAVGPGPRMTVRLGLRFREAPVDDRLEPAKNFAQATHWVQLGADTDPAEAASSLADLIGVAYDQNA